jgi:hypothetical protein
MIRSGESHEEVDYDWRDILSLSIDLGDESSVVLIRSRQLASVQGVRIGEDKVRQREFLIFLFRDFELVRMDERNETSLNWDGLLEVIESDLVIGRRLGLDQSLRLVDYRELGFNERAWIHHCRRIHVLWSHL